MPLLFEAVEVVHDRTAKSTVPVPARQYRPRRQQTHNHSRRPTLKHREWQDRPRHSTTWKKNHSPTRAVELIDPASRSLESPLPPCHDREPQCDERNQSLTGPSSAPTPAATQPALHALESPSLPRHDGGLQEEEEIWSSNAGQMEHDLAPPVRLPYQPWGSQEPFETVEYEDDGDMDQTCPFCGAKYWLKEQLQRENVYIACCNRGNVRLPPLSNPPPELLELYRNNRFFTDHVRCFNNTFAFASVGCKVDDRIIPGHGPQMFTARGEIWHRMGSILPSPGNAPAFAQVYFVDTTPDDKVRIRMSDVMDALPGNTYLT